MQKPTKLLITCRTTSYRACSKEQTEKQMANCQRKGLHNHVWRNGKPRINCAMPWCTVAVLQEECQGATWTFMQDSIAATTICSCHRRQKSITNASSTSSWFGGTAFMDFVTHVWIEWQNKCKREWNKDVIIYWADPGLKIGLLFNFSSIPYFSFTE